jgi:hypothetical protein
MMHPIFVDALKGFTPRELPNIPAQTKPLAQDYFSFNAAPSTKSLVNLADAYKKGQKEMAMMSHLCLHCGFEVHNNYSSGGECPKCGGCYWSSSSDEDYETEEERRG